MQIHFEVETDSDQTPNFLPKKGRVSDDRLNSTTNDLNP